MYKVGMQYASGVPNLFIQFYVDRVKQFYVTIVLKKSRIDSFRLKGYKENRLGHFWELSYDIYDRVEVNLHDRMMYTSFMKKNRLIAKRKKINLVGFI